MLRARIKFQVVDWAGQCFPNLTAYQNHLRVCACFCSYFADLRWALESICIYIYLFIYLFFYCLFLVVLGLRYCMQAFFSCNKQRVFSSCSARAFHCSGFSCCRAQALGTQASVVMAHELSCSRYVGSSRTRDQICVSCVGRQILLPLSQGGPYIFNCLITFPGNSDSQLGRCCHKKLFFQSMAEHNTNIQTTGFLSFVCFFCLATLHSLWNSGSQIKDGTQGPGQ